MMNKQLQKTDAPKNIYFIFEIMHTNSHFKALGILYYNIIYNVLKYHIPRSIL